MLSGDPDYIEANRRANFERLERELREARAEIERLRPRAILWDALERVLLERGRATDHRHGF